METDTQQIPTWCIQGKNWICKVPLDEHNAIFPAERQAEEAATRAIEQFQGQDKHLEIITENNETPEVGGIVLAYLKDSDPNDGLLLMVHELLANASYYKDSFELEQKTKAILEASIQAEMEAQKQKEIQESPEVKQDNPKKKKNTPRKPRKKKP